MMKKLIIDIILLTTGLVNAQDTLGIDSFNISIPQTNYFLDTLDFIYYPTTTGTNSNQNITTKVNVNPGAGTDNVEDTVLAYFSQDLVDFSQTKPQVTNSLVLRSAEFNNGNNTVVIWPDNGSDFSKDSVKLNVFLSGYQSVGPSPLLEKVAIKQYDKGVQLENKESTSITLRVFELSGRLVKAVELGPNETDEVSLTDGIYFITLIQENTYYLHKTRVLR